jgi:bacillolysin
MKTLVPNCSKLFQTVPNCSKLFQTVPNCSKLFQTVPNSTLSSFGVLTFFLLMFNSLAFGQSKGASAIPTFARKDNTVIASRTLEVKEHGWLYFRKQANVQPNELFTTYREAMGLRPEDEMKIVKSQKDDLGYAHNIYAQYYKGILVQNAGFSEHFKDNKVEVAHGKLIEQLNLDVNPRLTEAQALQFALDSIAAKEYAWQNPKFEKALKIELSDLNATYFPKGRLVITWIKNEVFTPDNYKLAWLFEIAASLPQTHRFVYIDAHNGTVVKALDDENHNGPAQTLYYGTQNIDTQFQGFWFGNDFRLFADENGRSVHTRRGDGDIWRSGWALDEVNDADDNWTGENATATTAHWTVSKAWDFYKGYFNRNGYDNEGKTVRVKAESSNNGSGSRFLLGHWIILFGFSNINQMHESTLDIAAHEFTHGVLHTTSGPGSGGDSGRSNGGENGAIAESLSDIMGLMAERYTFGDSPKNLTHGEDCGAVHRRFDPRGFADPDPNPILHGIPFPTFYMQAGAWDNGGEIHHNSSVMSFWFYLLSQGDSQTLPTVSGIGYDKAAQIVYRAMNCGYLTDNSKYIDARNATMRAAFELYGGCSMEEIEVSRAWAAVGIGGVKLCPVEILGHTDLSNGSICVPFANINYCFAARELPNSTFSWSYPSDWTAQVSGNYLCVSSFGLSSVGDYEYITATSNQTQQTGTFGVSFINCANFSVKRNDNSGYGIKAYPNPVVDKLTLEFLEEEHIQSISIFDNLGRLVLTKPISSLKTEINVADFTTGLYFVKTTGGDKSIHTFSFIKK